MEVELNGAIENDIAGDREMLCCPERCREGFDLV